MMVLGFFPGHALAVSPQGAEKSVFLAEHEVGKTTQRKPDDRVITVAEFAHITA